MKGRTLFAMLLCFVAAACGSGASSDERDYPFVHVEWSDCAVHEGDPMQGRALCAMVPVPLDWDDPDGEKIELFVQRYGEGSPSGKTNLWILHGGPDHCAGYGPVQEFFAKKIPKSEVFMLDHRGTGRSTRLECEGVDMDDPYTGQEVLADCISALEEKWNDGLDHFTTTAASRDVGYLMDLVDQERTKETYAYGVSYGTLWMQRFLQLFPDRLDGAVMEGIASVTRGYESANELAQEPFENLLNACKEDSYCSSYLGSNPLGELHQLLDEVESHGHCSALFGSFQEAGVGPSFAVKSILWLLMELGWDGRILVPATIYRLGRCEEEDIAAMAQMLEVFSMVLQEENRFASSALFYHIHMTSYWNLEHPKCAELPGVEHQEYSIYTTVPSNLCRLQELGWPAAPTDEFGREFADTNTPLLMLNGNMDVQTPTAGSKDVAESFAGPHQYFFELPRTGHSPLHDSFVADSQKLPCGMQMALQFFEDPKTRPDDGCVQEIGEIDFSGEKSKQIDDLAGVMFAATGLFD